MNSKLRPETVTAQSGNFCPDGADAYFILLQAVESQPGLIHGKLDGPKGAHCALGSYWDQHPKWAVPSNLVDEVAAINDSVPTVTPRRRKEIVTQWLNGNFAAMASATARRNRDLSIGHENDPEVVPGPTLCKP
jgi:hypothetical protein